MFNRLFAILCLCMPFETLAQGKTTDFVGRLNDQNDVLWI